jgi:hypothetical protein
MDNENKIKQALMGHTERLLHLGLDVLALQTCLFQKGIISEADLNEVKDQVYRDSKALLAQAANPEKQN